MIVNMETEELQRIASLSQDEQRALYPIIPQEQYEELIRLGICRRKIKLKSKNRTLYCNESNGAILFWDFYSNRLKMCGYFIDENHPKEIEYQRQLAEKKLNKKK